MNCYETKLGKLIYENSLASPEDIKDFILEGNAITTFPNGRLRLENQKDASEGQKANYVLWCPENFPADVLIEWNFWPVREPGLCIMFFSASGGGGEDIFDDSLAKRSGEYEMYHHGDINAFHISYFRRKESEERAFHTCNLRKSYGFHLVAQGADPIPGVIDAKGPYKIAIFKKANKIIFYVNELEIFNFTDDGKAYGPLLFGGKIGFRQLAPFIGEYNNLKVYAI
jgi:hypothetical protein